MLQLTIGYGILQIKANIIQDLIKYLLIVISTHILFLLVASVFYSLF